MTKIEILRGLYEQQETESNEAQHMRQTLTDLFQNERAKLFREYCYLYCENGSPRGADAVEFYLWLQNNLGITL